MKSTIVAVTTLAAVAAAQDISSLAQCGQLCANNMMAEDKAKELGCSKSDMKCLCGKKDFTYGFRDCSQAVCKGDDVSKVLAYVQSICKAAGVDISDGGKGDNGGSSDSTKTGGSGGDKGGDGSAMVSTIYSTFTSDGKVQSTPVATTTLGGAGGSKGGDGDNTSSGAGGNTGTASMTGGAGGSGTATGSPTSTVTKAPGTSSGAGGSGSGSQTSSGGAGGSGSQSSGGAGGSGSGSQTSSGAGGSGSGSVTSSKSDDAAPQKTAAPAAVLAAAGLAAFFL